MIIFFIHTCELILFMLPCSISLEQKKAMSLEIDTLKSLLENKTSTYITINSTIVLCVLSQGYNRMERLMMK